MFHDLLPRSLRVFLGLAVETKPRIKAYKIDRLSDVWFDVCQLLLQPIIPIQSAGGQYP